MGQEQWRKFREPHFELTNLMAVPGVLVQRRIGASACPKVPAVQGEYRQVGHETIKGYGLYKKGTADQGPGFLT